MIRKEAKPTEQSGQLKSFGKGTYNFCQTANPAATSTKQNPSRTGTVDILVRDKTKAADFPSELTSIFVR